MTSQVLRALEAKGLSEREVDPVDTRAQRLRCHQRRRRPTMPLRCSDAWPTPNAESLAPDTAGPDLIVCVRVSLPCLPRPEERPASDIG
ncbi:hypothetical protein M2164_008398 [Streptomyces sp. SAI-208]|uniref:hypothetical protein n=1 Tax=Streptomyces sp. SAI-208 TaxID=2940550 RepID=UPI0024772196|nr:hypothetical protein [Streptomyces sp. SAI-208]MDH6612763.1 hypothetical protein [Streptomyces sp. SAI-208]